MGRSCMAWGIVIWQRRSCMIKRRVAWQKKESSRTISRVLCVRANVSAIYPIHESPHGFSVLPSTGSRAGNPGGGSIHELAAPKMHSRTCHHAAGELLPHLLTISDIRRASSGMMGLVSMAVVVFFCITQPLRTASILGSGMPCAARTFLSTWPWAGAWATSSGRLSGCFPDAKIKVFCRLGHLCLALIMDCGLIFYV